MDSTSVLVSKLWNFYVFDFPKLVYGLGGSTTDGHSQRQLPVAHRCTRVNTQTLSQYYLIYGHCITSGSCATTVDERFTCSLLDMVVRGLLVIFELPWTYECTTKDPMEKPLKHNIVTWPTELKKYDASQKISLRYLNLHDLRMGHLHPMYNSINVCMYIFILYIEWTVK
jgi:hypothetical protein